MVREYEEILTLLDIKRLLASLKRLLGFLQHLGGWVEILEQLVMRWANGVCGDI